MCAHKNFSQYLFCDKITEKLHQRTGIPGVSNYKACAILRTDTSSYANSVATYGTVMVIIKVK
jgi:hypothetical protein